VRNSSRVGKPDIWPGEEDQKWMRHNGPTHFMMQQVRKYRVKVALAYRKRAADAGYPSAYTGIS